MVAATNHLLEQTKLLEEKGRDARIVARNVKVGMYEDLLAFKEKEDAARMANTMESE